MATPMSKRKTIDLSRLRELGNNLRQARVDRKAIDAYIESLELQIKEAMGDKEEAKIDGVLAFTYTKSDSFAWGEFTKAHPDIAETYRVPVTKVELDKKRLLAEHGGLVEPFRTRVFLVK